MCNLLITLYLPFSISNSKVIASHIIWKLQQKGFINYIRTCDTSTVYRMILWLQGKLIKRLQRKFKKKIYSCYYIPKRIVNSIFISWFHDEQRRSNNYLGIFLYSDAYKICFTQSLTRSGIFSPQFFLPLASDFHCISHSLTHCIFLTFDHQEVLNDKHLSNCDRYINQLLIISSCIPFNIFFCNLFL